MDILNKMYEFLVNYGIATKEEINLITTINGNNIKTYEDILYIRTGYQAFYQLSEWEGGDYNE